MKKKAISEAQDSSFAVSRRTIVIKIFSEKTSAQLHIPRGKSYLKNIFLICKILTIGCGIFSSQTEQVEEMVVKVKVEIS